MVTGAQFKRERERERKKERKTQRERERERELGVERKPNAQQPTLLAEREVSS